MKNAIYQEAINNKIQYHSEHVGRIKELSNREPVWSEPRKLFKKKRGNTTFAPYKVPTESVCVAGKVRYVGTIGVYKVIYDPTGETMSIGCGNIQQRLSRHRSVFLNKGRDITNPGGTTNGSATAGHMYKYDSNRKNWSFIWCSIENKSLANEYEDLLIKTEKPLFNKEYMGGK